MESKFYDGTKLLSMKDLNGEKPEILICTSNRSGGKTTFFSRYLINRFIKYKEKFCLLYRFDYEVADAHIKFFEGIKPLFFPNSELTGQYHAKQKYNELFYNGEPCGYAIAINNADTIKKYSHVYSDVQRCLMDEFQSEQNNYAPKEVEKFQSIHYSIARGNGKQYRFVQTILLSNPVTILNPYYVAMGVTSRINENVNFLKGNGWVLEQGYNETASQLQQQSGFFQAFNNDQNAYARYTTEGSYLNDKMSFIEKVDGKNKYICTLKYNGKEYAVREYAELGFLYVNKRIDSSFNNKISVTTQDHDVNYIMLSNNAYLLGAFRKYFELGCFRFADLECKECLIKALSY